VDTNRKMVVWVNPERTKDDGLSKRVLPTEQAWNLILEGTGYTFESVKQALELYREGNDYGPNQKLHPLFQEEKFLAYLPVGIKNEKSDGNYHVEDGTDFGGHSDVLSAGINETYWFNDRMIADKVNSAGQVQN